MQTLSLFELEEQKWDWTTTAVKKFMNGFKRFDGVLNEKEQVYIGVYGPTQVGKTTFILTLLGIRFDLINELSDALRGGRVKGQSATITCTIFEKSNEDVFNIIWPSGEKFTCHTLVEVEQIMGDLRQQVYQEDQFSLLPLIIKLPIHYFNIADIDQRIRDLSIIDLPGDDSKDLKEMQHVNRVLKEYITRCKVCVIMEIASQMTSLTKLEKEFVKDWLFLPEQFRIVLTRSVTNGSVMRNILEGKIQSEASFNELYRKELSEVCEVDDFGISVYPLEFGDSWRGLQETQPALFKKANIWVQGIFDGLVENLTKINSPEQEIKKIKSLECFIKNQHLQEIKQLTDKQTHKKKQLEELKISIKFGEKNLKLAEDEYKALSMQLDNLKKRDKHNIYLPTWSGLSYANKKVSYLRSQFYGELRDIKENATSFLEELNKKIRNLKRNFNLQLKTLSFPDDLFDKTFYMDYVLDRYFKDSTYNIDRKIALDKLANVNDEIYNYFVISIKELKKQIQKKLHSKLDTINDMERMVEQKYEEKDRIENKIAKLEIQVDKANQDWQDDIERSRQLDLFLKESFVEQSDAYKKQILNPNLTIEEKWLIHQYWNVLRLQAERMIGS